MIEIRNKILTGTDFSKDNFDKAIVTYCDMTDCIMPSDCQGANFAGSYGKNVDFSTNNSDLTDTNFHKCQAIEGFNLIGAVWNGVKITYTSSVLITDYYYTWCTNAFVQIGCNQRTIEEWEIIGSSLESITKFYAGNNRIDPQKTWNWWNKNKQIIKDWYNINI